jgi:DNA replication protein DnaC
MPGDDLRVEPCECQGDLRRSQRVSAANIPKRYLHCTLDTFRAITPALKNAKARVQQFVDEWPTPSDGKGLLLAGPVGTGKTHLAVAALLEVINTGKPGRVMFSNFSDLIQEIQASFDSDHLPTKAQLLGPLIEAELVVIDELGSQKPTEWITDTLYYIINSRYSEARTTIFTTNFMDQTTDVKESSLQLRIGAPLRSRLYEMAWRVEFTNIKDYRREKW